MRIFKYVDRLYLTALLTVSLFVYGCWFEMTNHASYLDNHWISFAKFYTVGSIIFSKDRQRIYEPAYQRERLATIVNPEVLPALEKIDGRYEFPVGFVEHPPHFIMMYAPFSLLKPLDALKLYTTVLWLIGVGGLIALTRAAKTLNFVQTLIIVVGATACSSSRFALVLGQPAWLLVGIYGAYMAAWLTKKNDRLAGIILAIATVKPQYPVFFGIASLITRRYRLLLWAVGIGLLLLVACIATVGINNVTAYLPMLSRMNSNVAFAGDDVGMPSMRGLVSNWFGAVAGIKSGYVFTLMEAILISFVWWRTDKLQKDPRWAFAATVLMILLLSPHTFRYDCFFFYVLPAALTLNSLTLNPAEPKPNPNLKNTSSVNMGYAVWRYLFLAYPVISSVLGLLSITNNILVPIEVAINLVFLGLALYLWSASTAASAQTELTEASAN